MATCRDCISFSRCKEMYEAFGIYINLENSAVCKHFKSKDNVVEAVRCKDCKYYKVGNPNADYCYHERYEGLSQSASYEPDDFCSYGTPKERVKDKPKITCLNCKHLMFSDMYGECNKQLRIVNPSDTCEFAELKETVGENE